MKFSIFALLVLNLLVGVAVLLNSMGIISLGSGGGKGGEFVVLMDEQLDKAGFKRVAEKNDIPIDEEGKAQFSKEFIDSGGLSIFNVLPESLAEAESQGLSFLFEKTIKDQRGNERSIYIFRKR